MKYLKIVLVSLLLLLLIPAYFAYKYNSVINSPIGQGSEKVNFDIEEGMTGDMVIAALAKDGIIREEETEYLRAYIRINNIPHFQEGRFSFPRNLNVEELFETLQNPENPDVWVTIPEGLRKDEIGDILAEEFSGREGSVFSRERFMLLTEDPTYIATLDLNVEGLANLEGYLFPDKYLIPVESTEEYVINTFINNFKNKAGEISYENLIIASMVEREGLSDEDRPLIADVIMSRLNEGGWLLQIDATLLYYYADWEHVITQQDKETNQPYNTYFNAGLPPTPISNPGASAINAVLNPTPNPYYYYIHDNDGNAHFATTLAEHEQNIATYLR